VWEQMLDTLSNFCDNNNIHLAIWMKLSFFDKYDTIFNFILQFYLRQIWTFKFPKVVRQHV